MGNKISTYTAITTLANGDKMDWSKDMGAGVYATRSITYANLLAELNADLTFPTPSNLGNANLTADANARTYTLFGNTASQYVQFLNTDSRNILKLKGDRVIEMGENTYNAFLKMWVDSGSNNNIVVTDGTNNFATFNANDRDVKLYNSSGTTNVLFNASAGASYINGNIAVGTNSTANASTVLDIISTNKGLGLPSMTTTQKNAISTPRAGVTVYDSTLNFPYYYNGSAWSSIGSNLGNANLTADANARTYTLFGSTSSQYVSFLNAAASQLLGLRGDKKITLLTSTYATVASVNYDVSLGDASNGKSFIHYLGSNLSNDFAIKHINSANGNAMHSVSTGSAPKYQYWNYETSSNADLTIYQSSSNARIALNSPSTATWQTALSFSGQGTELITLSGSNFWFSGIIDVKNGSGVTQTSLRAKRSQGYLSWFGEGAQMGGTDGIFSTSALLDLYSTSQGLGLPSMTTTQKNAISSPRAGLLVFDDDLNQISYYTGAAWVNL